MQMNTSIVPGFTWTEEALKAAISERRSQARFSENELVESLLSLAAMVDLARESERGNVEGENEGQGQEQDQDQDPPAGVSRCEREERFSFFCGWDRLVARYRESCAKRVFQSAH
jgi:hypothetical protein